MKENPNAIAAKAALEMHQIEGYPLDGSRAEQMEYTTKKMHLETLFRSFAPIYEVGDGITRLIGSDSHAYTVIAVSKSGKQITVQRDKAILDPAFKPDTIVGGFAGHTANNNAQSYSYERDADGEIDKVSLRTTTWDPKHNSGVSKFQDWVTVGVPTRSTAGKWRPGRSEFYDYNF